MATAAPSSADQEALLVSSLQVATQSWAKFDWGSKGAQWNSTSSTIKEAREQSVAARKKLADTTKQFKRSVKSVEQSGASLKSVDNPTAASAVKTIDVLAKDCRLTVKSYQEEIDNLTRRCKLSENSFSALCQSLNECPDPAAVLSMAMDHVNRQQTQMSRLLRTVNELNSELAQQQQQLTEALAKSSEASKAASSNESSSGGMGKSEREELLQLRREVAEYEVEFRSLKNQDITIRKLEARIQEMQESGEAERDEQLEKAKLELAETEGRRATEALEREAAMERRVQTLELQLQAEIAGRAATQAHLLEADEGVGEREAAWEAQRRILIDDSERLRESLHEASRERDELRLRVAAIDGDSSHQGHMAPPSGGISMADLLLERKAYEAEVSELSHTANSLREELRIKEDSYAEERRSAQSKLDALEREQTGLKKSLSSLEAQLSEAPSQSLVDSMRHELRILKRLEYNADDIEADERDPEMTGGSQVTENDLESVLVAKLRRVESQLVKERNQREELASEVKSLRQQLEVAETAKNEAERLIASLEADLDRAIATPASSSPSVQKKKRTSEIEPVVAPENPATLQQVLDPDAPPLSGPPPTPKMSSVSANAAEKAHDDHSVATIIMAQRDRLRARCEALEAERDSFKRELQAQVSAAESLKADNTKLFEKMRYLQSYNGSSGGASSTARRTKIVDRDLDLEALEQRYEASVDPFRQFGRAERQRKMNEMSPMERTVFVVAKTVLGTKEMRTFLFFYVVALHTLVFLTTYHWSHNDASMGCSIANNEHLSHLPPIVDKTAEEVMNDLSGN